MGGTLVVEPKSLQKTGASLTRLASTLGGSVKVTSPDAGASTNEVADLIQRVVEEATTACTSLRSLAGALETAAMTFCTTDATSAERIAKCAPMPPPVVTAPPAPSDTGAGPWGTSLPSPTPSTSPYPAGPR